jgi:chaperonin GroES
MKKTKKPVRHGGKVTASKKAVKKSVSAGAKSTKNAIGVMPLGDRIVVKPLSPEESATTSAFGILIPDSSKEKPEQGTVVAIGPGKNSDDGKIMPMTVKVGDRVMFSKYGFDEIKVGGVEYLILPESSVLAVIEK